MNPHDPRRIVSPPARQYWRAFAYVMQVHENHCIKRAGVAGLRARAPCPISWLKSLQAESLQFIFQWDLSAKIKEMTWQRTDL
ncbi:hypothetical protein AL522_23200 [Pantoea vagans]|nr:hypothetical protein AL522_23200 [Pantoea vagans]